MGKNHKHKKAIKADKAKTKLKQTKTKLLPKGQNVTNTQFKIKPIVLYEQLKEKTGETPLSKRKLDVNDLLSRLKHHNENIRHFACEELSEMLKIYPVDIMTTYLSQVILGVSSLMQDREAKVRKAVVKAIKVILEVIPEHKLEPFYNYFVINLCCAMSNINPNIQEYSLKYLDCFINQNIDSSCGLITKYSEKILPELLALISKIRSDSKLKRTLTVNLGSNMSSITWKIKVLIELLNVVRNISKSNVAPITETNVIYDDSSKVNWFGLYKKRFSDVLEESSSDWDIINESKKNSTDALEKNMFAIVPLLYETWMEVMPETQRHVSATANTPLEAEAAAVLIIIVHMLNALQIYAVNNNFNFEIYGTKECEKLFTSLLLHFPYCAKDSKTTAALSNLGLLDPNPNQRFILLNLQLSTLFIRSKGIVKKHVPEKEQKMIYSYINKCLTNKSVDKENLEILILLIKYCTKLWKTLNVDNIRLLEKTVNNYGSIDDDFVTTNLKYFNKLLQSVNH